MKERGRHNSPPLKIRGGWEELWLIKTTKVTQEATTRVPLLPYATSLFGFFPTKFMRHVLIFEVNVEQIRRLQFALVLLVKRE